MIEFLLLTIALLIAYFGRVINKNIISNNKLLVENNHFMTQRFQSVIFEISQKLDESNSTTNQLRDQLESMGYELNEIKFILEDIKPILKKYQIEDIEYNTAKIEDILKIIELNLTQIVDIEAGKEPLSRNPDLKNNSHYQAFMDELDQENK